MTDENDKPADADTGSAAPLPASDTPPGDSAAPIDAPAAPVGDAAAPAGERIAKVMARAGVASRREAERMILAGRVAVNGAVIASPALDVLPADQVMVDGKPLDAPQETRLWLYFKPAGLVTSEADEKGRQTVFDALPDDLPRVMTVGRLDLTSEGLLLLTNDGELKRRLELPSTGWTRRYRVRVNGQPSALTFAPLQRGVVIDGEEFQPMEIEIDSQRGANAWLTVSIREGRNREVRRAMAHVGLTVNRLIRIGYGPFKLGDLEKNEVREVRRRVLRDQLGGLLDGESGGGGEEAGWARPGAQNRRDARGPMGRGGDASSSRTPRAGSRQGAAERPYGSRADDRGERQSRAEPGRDNRPNTRKTGEEPRSFGRKPRHKGRDGAAQDQQGGTDSRRDDRSQARGERNWSRPRNDERPDRGAASAGDGGRGPRFRSAHGNDKPGNDQRGHASGPRDGSRHGFGSGSASGSGRGKDGQDGVARAPRQPGGKFSGSEKPRWQGGDRGKPHSTRPGPATGGGTGAHRGHTPGGKPFRGGPGHGGPKGGGPKGGGGPRR